MIIGLAGTLNAGKDSLANMLAERHGFLHMSTSDMLRELKRRKFGDSPEALLRRNDPYANKLRNEKGPGFLVDAINEEWLANQRKYPGGFVASAIRAIGEAEKIHELGGIVIFVDANPKIRYARSQARQRDANEVGKSFDEFMATERSEIDVDPTDKAVQNLTAMKEMADIVITNNGDNIEEFKNKAEKILAKYL